MVFMSDDFQKTTPRFCGNCGQKLLEGATFCAHCGSQVPPVDSTGIVSTKPSSGYTPIPPAVTDRVSPGYPTSYGPPRIKTEPPLPFTQHFQGVLISPQVEMPRIAKRPNIGQPFLIVIIVGIIAGVTLFVLNSKINIQFSDTFMESFGLSGMEGFDMGEYMQFFMMLTAFFTPFGFIVSWVIASAVLWILHAIISSQVPSHERNFKTMATVIGWSFLPRIFNELIRLVAYFIFIQPSTLIIDDILDFSLMSAPVGIIGDMFFFVDIFFLIWGVALVYFAAKSIDPEGNHAIIIGIIYAIFSFLFG